MSHVQDLSLFRHIDSTPSSKTSISSLNRATLPETLSYLIKLLDEAMYVSERRDLFSLINITTQSGNSIGYSRELPEELITTSSALTFTFSLKARPLKHLTSQKQLRVQGKFVHTRYWGYDSNNEYLTIIMTNRDTSLYDMVGDNLKAFYRLVGVYTKNFVLDSSWYDGSFSHTMTDIDRLYSLYESVPFEDILKRVPLSDWIFCKDGVRFLSHVFQPEMINPVSMEYICKYLPKLADFKASSYSGTSYNSHMHVWLTKGVSDFYTWLNGGQETAELRSVLYMSWANESDKLFPYLDLEYIRSKYKDVKTSYNSSTVARAVLDGYTLEALWL